MDLSFLMLCNVIGKNPWLFVSTRKKERKKEKKHKSKKESPGLKSFERLFGKRRKEKRSLGMDKDGQKVEMSSSGGKKHSLHLL